MNKPEPYIVDFFLLDEKGHIYGGRHQAEIMARSVFEAQQLIQAQYNNKIRVAGVPQPNNTKPTSSNTSENSASKNNNSGGIILLYIGLFIVIAWILSLPIAFLIGSMTDYLEIDAITPLINTVISIIIACIILFKAKNKKIKSLYVIITIALFIFYLSAKMDNKNVENPTYMTRIIDTKTAISYFIDE